MDELAVKGSGRPLNGPEPLSKIVKGSNDKRFREKRDS